MVGDSASLRQDADMARQAHTILNQQVGGLLGEINRADDDQKSLIETRIFSLKVQISGALGDVNRTSAEYSSAVAKERSEELIKEVKEDEERIKLDEKENEKESEIIENKKRENTEAVKQDLLFLSDDGGVSDGHAADFTTANVTNVKNDSGNSTKNEEAVVKSVAGSGAASS